MIIDTHSHRYTSTYSYTHTHTHTHLPTTTTIYNTMTTLIPFILISIVFAVAYGQDGVDESIHLAKKHLSAENGKNDADYATMKRNAERAAAAATSYGQELSDTYLGHADTPSIRSGISPVVAIFSFLFVMLAAVGGFVFYVHRQRQLYVRDKQKKYSKKKLEKISRKN